MLLRTDVVCLVREQCKLLGYPAVFASIASTLSHLIAKPRRHFLAAGSDVSESRAFA